ncbi:transposable element Tc3 transposase [Trichonephila clavipes]|uniref:Transposable element Tc3 transposase n=1 Tax=Trichonephila clavipes TaxID=2585209 RepID=A0A8X6S1G1_TRICX|nr:transposable element Tc3 transposase [Trichonephila clavipes]
MCSRRHGGGRVRSTTPAEDRYIVLSAKKNRRTTAQHVANQFLAASGKQISRKTVARRLRGGGLYARRPVVCVPLTRQHRTARLQWCREHHNWTEQDWACVLFSDERKGPISDMQYHGVGRHHDQWPHAPTCGCEWDYDGQRYIDEVLLPHVRLFRGAVGDIFVFMDDNATCHRTLAVQDCLDSEGIQRLVWPARSPDLNTIENVWDALGRQVAGRNYPPTHKNTLIRALTEEWDKLPQQLLDNVVQKRGLRQGYSLACLLFNLVLEKCILDSGLDRSGTLWNRSLQLLAYADDIDIIGRSEKAVKEDFQALEISATNMGLTINEDKTKFMEILPSSVNNTSFCVNGHSFERVSEFKYLGTIINDQNKLKVEINNRIKLRWLGHIWRSPENNQTRAYTFKNPMASRTRGRPPTRWIDDVENDLKILNMKKLAESCCVSLELEKASCGGSQDL